MMDEWVELGIRKDSSSGKFAVCTVAGRRKTFSRDLESTKLNDTQHPRFGVENEVALDESD